MWIFQLWSYPEEIVISKGVQIKQFSQEHFK